MIRPLIKIFVGVIVLFVFVYVGIPFEIDNAVTVSIFRTLSFACIFTLLFLLYKQAKKINKKEIRITNYIALGILAIIFVLGALWNNIWVFEKNERNTWYNLEVCTNPSGTKILRQIRETSGSIYDYRDRLVIYEFDKNNRISINTKVQNYDGPWTVYNVKNSTKQKVQRLE